MSAILENSKVRVAERLDRVTAEFSRLDQAAAIHRIQSLADSGFSETEIATITRFGILEVRRAIGERA